jgi:ribosomal protein S18 acetylase RimI-like enzyme
MARFEIVRLERASVRTVREIADLHRASIPRGFLSALGSDALGSIYAAIIGSRHGFVLVALEEGRCRGFLAASLLTRRVQLDIIKSSWRQLVPVILRHGTNPKVLLGVAELFLYTVRPQRRVATPAAEILNLCVDPLCRGAGIGSRLFQAMCAEYERQGIRQITIITGAHQREAQRLYERWGARRVGEATVHAGSISLRYVLALPCPGAVVDSCRVE